MYFEHNKLIQMPSIETQVSERQGINQLQVVGQIQFIGDHPGNVTSDTVHFYLTLKGWVFRIPFKLAQRYI